jgi:hypothetical protein
MDHTRLYNIIDLYYARPRSDNYHTQNVVCKECLCYKNDEYDNDFSHDGVASTNEDEGFPIAYMLCPKGNERAAEIE